MLADRKTGYKLPPTTIRDKLISQESRRAKALEEQKRVGSVRYTLISVSDHVHNSAEHKK
jgi:hypothetical protein